ncbi:MAG: GAF domain-containing sensor histidine kinase [Chloroflexota bacterium]|nr:GAF domain-containing sensor histidine kinase [Chloroflexota bacterium]
MHGVEGDLERDLEAVPRSGTAREDRLRLLVDASTAVASTLDLDESLAALARLTVPRLADWCAIDLLDGTYLRRIGVAHVDPDALRALRALGQRRPPRLDDADGVGAVVREARPLHLPQAEPTHLGAHSPDELALVRAVGLGSFICVPLVAHARAVGAVSFATAGSGRAYGPEDAAFAAELAARVALGIDNARLYRQLEDALRTRDEFLSAVSHDLKSPLTSLKGWAQLLERRVGPSRDPDRAAMREPIRHIVRATTTLASLIDELLDVARLEMGQPLELDRRPVDLVEMARRCVAEYQQRTSRHRIALDVSSAELVGEWDGVRVERVITNLLSNAVKYSPYGGEIVVALGEEQVGDRRWATLSVRDHGMGIGEDDLPRIFDRFFRGRRATGSAEGSGIGLATAQRLVDLHGGRIDVESHEGEGSTFTVRLPLAPPPS